LFDSRFKNYSPSLQKLIIHTNKKIVKQQIIDKKKEFQFLLKKIINIRIPSYHTLLFSSAQPERTHPPFSYFCTIK